MTWLVLQEGRVVAAIAGEIPHPAHPGDQVAAMRCAEQIAREAARQLMDSAVLQMPASFAEVWWRGVSETELDEEGRG